MEELKAKAGELGHKHMVAIATDLNDVLIPLALDELKAKINGPFDDIAIDALKPVLHAKLAELIAGM